MQSKVTRAIPRPYKLHWESGQIVEEASSIGKFHEACIQLLQAEDSTVTVRFCWYNLSGQYQRSPLLISEEELEGLQQALISTPRLKKLLEKLVVT
jgi:hypothetical protein